jgi:hypothetical protein
VTAFAIEAAEPQELLKHGHRLVWEAELAIHRDDPYFFDHPLDHVPAMLLVETTLLLAGQAVASSDGDSRPKNFRRLHLEFHRFCELDEPPLVRLWAVPGAPERWRVEFIQAGHRIGEGTVDGSGNESGDGDKSRSHAETVSAGRGPGSAAVDPVPANVVHRTRPENVLIGGFGQVGDDDYFAELLTPPTGHYLRRRSDRVRTLGELMEGIRQFGTMLGHEARDVAVGKQFIVKSIDISVDRPVSRHERVLVRSNGLPSARGQGSGAMAFSLCIGDHVIGQAQVEGLVVPDRVYQRLRAMSSQAAKENQ